MRRIFTALLLMAISYYGWAQEEMEVSTGSGNEDMVWYSLEGAEIKAKAKLNDWHLAFSIRGISSTILANNASGTKVWLYNGPVDDFATMDTAKINTWRPLWNSDTSWSYGALSQPADMSDPFDLGWGTYDMTTHQVRGNRIFVVKVPSGAYFKVLVEKLASGTYHLRYATLDNQTDETIEVAKSAYEGKNFAYVDLTTGEEKDLEPTANTWDLVFQKYTTAIAAGPQTLYYPVGGILQNSGVTATQVYPVDNPTKFADYSSQDFSTEINVIGYDWKTFDRGSNVYIIEDSTVYFVKTAAGDIWKLIMKDYGGSATGNMTFSQEKIYSTNLQSAEQEAFLSVFPNPVSQGRFTVVTGASAQDQATISLLNANGQVLQQKVANGVLQQTQMSGLGLEPGVYFVKVQTSNATNLQKIVIQ